MQSHYGFIRSLNLKEIETPYNFKKQFIIYSREDNYPKKLAVQEFLRSSRATLAFSHVLVARTRQPYTLAGNFVLPSRANFQRFLSFLRVIKPNNSFLESEAFHTGHSFGSATLYGSDDIPYFLSGSNEVEILHDDLDLVKRSMHRISRLKIEQAHRINNFYGYLDYCVRGPINHRIIWMFIALESLFHLQGERGYTKNLCKRISYFLEPTHKVSRKKIYDFLLDAAEHKRGKLVHGGVVSNEAIKDTLVELEPLLWRIGNLLLTTDKKWLKLFSSLDSELEKYFRLAQKQPLS